MDNSCSKENANFQRKAKMADDLGSIAWSFLPENVQVQYLQKIALRAENPSGPKHISISLRIEQIKQIISLVKQRIR